MNINQILDIEVCDAKAGYFINVKNKNPVPITQQEYELFMRWKRNEI